MNEDEEPRFFIAAVGVWAIFERVGKIGAHEVARFDAADEDEAQRVLAILNAAPREVGQ